MNNRLVYIKILFAGAMMALLIIDPYTARKGAADGLTLCFDALIPSLFPFFVVSNYLCNALTGQYIPGINRIRRKLELPNGCEPLIMVGLLGGYPVGAQLIANAYHNGMLDKRTARILLGYCSNAGPAFIFGVAGSLFSSSKIAFVLWLIHMTSAMLTGYLLPKPAAFANKINTNNTYTLVQSLRNGIRACVSVCGWVIVFKVLLSYLSHIFPQTVDNAYWMLFSGILELSNGCIQLRTMDKEIIKFLICSFLLSFGGICVLFQTASVTGDLGLGMYIPGKIIQSIISILIALLLSPILFPYSGVLSVKYILLAFMCGIGIYMLVKYCKKDVEILL